MLDPQTQRRGEGPARARDPGQLPLLHGIDRGPGGFGTLDEMFEMLTWRQLGLGKKPCAFLDVDGFYAPLMGMIDRMVEERFLHPEQRNDLWHGDDLDAMVAWMRAYTPAQADKWMDEKRRKSLR